MRLPHGCIASNTGIGARLAYALQQLINGVTLGMIYGLIAVGYTMVYGIIGMINFAHGDVFMVGLLSLPDRSAAPVRARHYLRPAGPGGDPVVRRWHRRTVSAGPSSASPTARSEVHSASRR